MFSVSARSIKSLIESSGPTHLTAYLVNNNDLGELENQISRVIEKAHRLLDPVLTAEQVRKFLSPIVSLSKNQELLYKFKSNIGLFRTRNDFRIINIPVTVDETCIIADSFHIKPLLRWMQMDRDFFLLGINKDQASLHAGNLQKLKRLGDFPISEQISQHPSLLVEKINSWLSDQIPGNSEVIRPRIYVYGSRGLTEPFSKSIGDLNFYRLIDLVIENSNPSQSAAEHVRKILKMEAKWSLEMSLSEFRWAENTEHNKRNIFQIAQAAIQGRVRKLLIADGVKIFGKIDKKTGGLKVHPGEINHEDDDILDDLSQLVLAHGGNVVVAPQEEIPKGRVLQAILNNQDSEPELQISKTERTSQTSLAQEHQ